MFTSKYTDFHTFYFVAPEFGEIHVDVHMAMKLYGTSCGIVRLSDFWAMFPLTDLLPQRTCSLHGLVFRCPGKVTNFLRHLYGPDWYEPRLTKSTSVARGFDDEGNKVTRFSTKSHPWRREQHARCLKEAAEALTVSFFDINSF